MPTLSDIIAAVSTFVGDYAVYIAGALVLGLGTYVVTALIRRAR